MSAPNPFAWMPKCGQSIQIPGGRILCDEWTIKRELHTGQVSGEIRFVFHMDAKAYQEAMQENLTEGPPAIECEVLPKISNS